MKSKLKTMVSAFIAVSMATGGLAFADDRDGRGKRNDRGRNEQAQHRGGQDYRDNAGRRPDRQENQGRAHDNRRRADENRGHAYGKRGHAYFRDERRDERGAGPHHEFHRGQRLPVEYRSRQYVVEDWRGHHLSAPPRGYHWVQTGGDYVLAAIATGVILQLLLGH